MEAPQSDWSPGIYGKGLLYRPRRDRADDYSLLLFHDSRPHYELEQEVGNRSRLVARLLVYRDGRFVAFPAGRVAQSDIETIVQRLDGRLRPHECRHGSKSTWHFP